MHQIIRGKANKLHFYASMYFSNLYNKLPLITFVQIRDFNADSAERLAWIETRTFSNVNSKKNKKRGTNRYQKVKNRRKKLKKYERGRKHLTLLNFESICIELYLIKSSPSPLVTPWPPPCPVWSNFRVVYIPQIGAAWISEYIPQIRRPSNFHILRRSMLKYFLFLKK